MLFNSRLLAGCALSVGPFQAPKPGLRCDCPTVREPAPYVKLSMMPFSSLSGFPPLHRAAASGDVVLVESLLGDFDIHESYRCWRPLEWACRYGQIEVARFLLDNGADAHITQDADDYYIGEAGPIHLAVSAADSLPLVELLLSRGVSVVERTLDDATPLHLARSAKMARFLIPLVKEQGKWGIEERDIEGLTPIHYAASNGHSAVLCALLEASADPHDDDAEASRTPFHRAARNRHLKCCKLLWETGADINALAYHDATPLDQTLTYARQCDANPHISLTVFVSWMLERGATATKFSAHQIAEMMQPVV